MRSGHASGPTETTVFVPEYFCLDYRAAGLTPDNWFARNAGMVDIDTDATVNLDDEAREAARQKAQAEHAEAEKRERRKVLALNKLGDAAMGVRRDFVKKLLARKTPASAGAGHGSDREVRDRPVGVGPRRIGPQQNHTQGNQQQHPADGFLPQNLGEPPRLRQRTARKQSQSGGHWPKFNDPKRLRPWTFSPESPSEVAEHQIGLPGCAIYGIFTGGAPGSLVGSRTAGDDSRRRTGSSEWRCNGNSLGLAAAKKPYGFLRTPIVAT